MVGAVIDEGITAVGRTLDIHYMSRFFFRQPFHCQSSSFPCGQHSIMLDTTIFPRAGGQADFDFYKYNPSRPAGWTFCILFAMATVVHFGYIVPYRSWFFVPFTLGCAGELLSPTCAAPQTFS
jgi:hypothetical protein